MFDFIRILRKITSRFVCGGVPLAAITLAATAHADCIDNAARYQQVHPYVLRAIAYHESNMRADITHYNTNRTIDYGVMGINSVHIPELSSFGIAPEQLLDPCINAYVGAWYLRRKMEKYGNTWQAVAAYHSETPEVGAAYVKRIQNVLTSWGGARYNHGSAINRASRNQAALTDRLGNTIPAQLPYFRIIGHRIHHHAQRLMELRRVTYLIAQLLLE